MAEKLKKLTKETTLTIEFELTREFVIRKWIAVRLIILAAWILGCGVEVIKENKHG